MTTTDATALAGGIDRLEQAAGLIETRLGRAAAADLLAVCGRLRERLARGVDHTVVALEGGTGSGKSSLFNAIAEMAFAEVGVLRPTTAKATACVWGEGAGQLLDWLGIERDSWIQRDSVLESHLDELRGMILVDLPDYDSAVAEHRTTADKVLPLADVLVWVTDPQKYADPALHERFAALAAAHEGRTHIVVLNQIDTIDPEDAQAIAQAMTELLVEGGLADPVVALTSATQGDGVDGLREALVAQTVHHTTAMLRTAADLGGAASLMAAKSGEEMGQVPDAAQVAWLAGAGQAAASAVATAVVQAAGEGETALTLAVPAPPAADRLAAVRDAWLAQARQHVPAVWVDALEAALPAEGLEEWLARALAGVELPARPGFWRRVFAPARTAATYRREYERRVAAAVEPAVEAGLTKPAGLVLADRAAIAQAAAEIAALARRAQA
jgi:GTP-binding protein EngB required for normal cell division